MSTARKENKTERSNVIPFKKKSSAQEEEITTHRKIQVQSQENQPLTEIKIVSSGFGNVKRSVQSPSCVAA